MHNDMYTKFVMLYKQCIQQSDEFAVNFHDQIIEMIDWFVFDAI